MANIHRTVCDHCNASVDISLDSPRQHAGRCPYCSGTVELHYSASESPTDDFGPRVSDDTDEYVPTDENQVNKWSRVLPRSVGRFEILGWLGSGGYGDVYLAVDPRLNRRIALKVLREERVDARRKRRFIQEAEAAAQLSHEGIVRVWETGEDDGKLWIALELVEGHSLADELKDHRLTHRRAAEIAIEIASALGFAHSRRITHRDVKPANVLLDDHGRVKITDLGLARRTDTSEGMTETRAVIGSVDYMSPEQASGLSRQADGRTDIYSLGVVLFEMLTGEVPRETIKRLQEKGLTPPEPIHCRAADPSVPQELDAICRKAMEIDPRNRHSGMEELSRSIRFWLDTQSSPVPTSVARPASETAKQPEAAKTVSLPVNSRGRVARRSLAAVAFVLGSAFLGWRQVSVTPQETASPPASTTASRIVAAVNREPAFIGNHNSKTVHSARCKHAISMSSNNRIEFRSLAEAQARGFKNCAVCRPDRHEEEVARADVD